MGSVNVAATEVLGGSGATDVTGVTEVLVTSDTVHSKHRSITENNEKSMKS